ncbi:MAG: adenylosuccinate synthetase [Myxococcota bacterium]|nr:adenylosuccinate synthetase [Myxococcota bacterium]
MSRRASIVVDLGFGDAGKGTVVDFLVRDRAASLVVRFNGGAQAGHGVVTDDGRRHVFAQLGAGSFVPGVRTHLSRFVVVHPTALLVEARRLAAQGVTDALARLTLDERALVTTPYHQALCRLRELARGDAAHGTTGVGVGETMRVALEAPALALRAAELREGPRLRRKLEALRDHAAAALDRLTSDDPRFAVEREAVLSPATLDAWIDALRPLRAARVVEGPEGFARRLAEARELVFEGAQGVLLDEWRGFHPHTTWSTCTADNALALLDGWDGEIERLGVLRSYATRHGQGPFPTEVDALRRLPEADNLDAGWQGRFRRGWLDLPLLRYALACCPVDGLALTHLDRVEPGWRACVGYVEPVDLTPAVDPHDLDHVERLGRRLRAVTPILEPTGPDLASWLSERLAPPIRLTSSSPTASGKRWRPVSSAGEAAPRAPRRPGSSPRPRA